MQCCKSQVSGFGDTKRHLDSLEIAHFADKHNVRILSKGGPKSGSERVRIGRNLALIDHAVLVIVEKLDRVFDSQDVIMTVYVDLVHHRGKSGRLTRAGRPGDKYQSAGLFAHVADDRRQAKSIERFDLVRDSTKDRADRAPF